MNKVIKFNQHDLKVTYAGDDHRIEKVEKLFSGRPIVTLKAEQMAVPLTEREIKNIHVSEESGLILNPVMQLKLIVELASQSGMLKVS